MSYRPYATVPIAGLTKLLDEAFDRRNERLREEVLAEYAVRGVTPPVVLPDTFRIERPSLPPTRR